MRNLILVASLVLGFASTGWSLSYTGSVSNGNGLTGQNNWTTGVSLSWTVNDTDNAGLWTYIYQWKDESTETSNELKEKSLSHINIEVSDTFTTDNIKTGTTAGYALDDYDTTNGNPGIPENLYGLKWNTTDESVFAFDFTIVSDRMPMWGDFYAKDGGGTGSGAVIAYNSGFLFTTEAAIGDGNAMADDLAWVLVPDTDNGTFPPSEVVPEPSTILLLGAGLIGLGYYGRRKRS